MCSAKSCPHTATCKYYKELVKLENKQKTYNEVRDEVISLIENNIFFKLINWISPTCCKVIISKLLYEIILPRLETMYCDIKNRKSNTMVKVENIKRWRKTKIQKIQALEEEIYYLRQQLGVKETNETK